MPTLDSLIIEKHARDDLPPLERWIRKADGGIAVGSTRKLLKDLIIRLL